MLGPDEIERLGNVAQTLLDPIQEFLIKDICKRVQEAGKITSTAAYQIWKLQKLGLGERDIKKRIKKLLNSSTEELNTLFMQSAKSGYGYDLSRLPTEKYVSFAKNKSVQDIIKYAVSVAGSDLTNIVRTIGFVSPDGSVLGLTAAYKSACDFAFKMVSTGSQSYDEAVRNATKNLAEKGIRQIDYESGRSTTLEAAVRRSVMGGLGLMQEKISESIHDDLGCDGWELSAHFASAPDHEPYQGKQYTDAEYKELNDRLERRIGTLNCGHSAHPIILGVSEPVYTSKELEEMKQENKAGVRIDGKHYKTYEATQQQRAIERAIRLQKRRVLVAEQTNSNKLNEYKIRLNVLLERYKLFSEQAGLRTQWSRTYTTVKDSRY